MPEREGPLFDYDLTAKKGYCCIEEEHDCEEQGHPENVPMFASYLRGNVLSNQVAF